MTINRLKNGYMPITPEEQIEIVLSRIVQQHAIIAPDYKDYINSLLAIDTAFGEKGRQYAHAAFQYYPKYKAEELDKHYSDVHKSNHQEVNIGTFYFHCQQAGIDTKICEADAYKEKRKPGRPCLHKNESVEKRHRATTEEIELFLKTQAETRKNKMTSFTEIKMKDNSTDGEWVRISEEIVNTLCCRMDKQLNVSVRKTDMLQVIGSEFSEGFHPFKNFLNHCKEWKDGNHDYIADLANTVHVDGDQAAWTSDVRKKIVAILAGVLTPDKFDQTILTLVSERQGMYKTTWVRFILPPELRMYCYTKTNGPIFSKDDMWMMSQYIIICLDEITACSGKALNKLKGIITTPAIDQRPPYGHFVEHNKRICSFAATGNSVNFLDDPTGTRRWVVYKVDNVDYEALQALDYEGIYGQALHLLDSGFQYWYDEEEIKQLNRANKQFEIPDLIAEQIDTHFCVPDETHVGIWVKNSDIYELVQAHSKDIIDSQKIGYAMKRLGFQKSKRGGYFYYYVHQFEGAEIEARKREISNELDNKEGLPF